MFNFLKNTYKNEFTLDNITFDWKVSASDAKALILSGYCSTNPSISCDDSNCSGTCEEEESIAFAFIPKSIGVAVEYTIKAQATRDYLLGYKTEEVCILTCDNDGNAIDGTSETNCYNGCIDDEFIEELVSEEKQITINPIVIETRSATSLPFLLDPLHSRGPISSCRGS